MTKWYTQSQRHVAYLLPSLCVAACLACIGALDPNIGTGKNCATASDAVGGPRCQGYQIGLCCNALESSSNCLTLFSDGSDPAATLNEFLDNGVSTTPTCSQVMLNGQPLSPFCCDEMDLPNCPTAAVESAGFPGNPTGCVDDIVQFCCADAGAGGMGGTDCISVNGDYTTTKCPEDRPIIFCC